MKIKLMKKIICDLKINNDKNNVDEGNNIIEENDSGFNILKDNKEEK